MYALFLSDHGSVRTADRKKQQWIVEKILQSEGLFVVLWYVWLALGQMRCFWFQLSLKV